MERVVQCPVCFDDDLCFEESTVLDSKIELSSYLCFNCGFMSDSRFTMDSEEFNNYIKSSPKLVQQLQFEDKKRNIMWFPSVVNMGSKGIIFPEGNMKMWVWKYAEVIDIPPNMREKYDGHEKRLDVENAKSYEQYSFLEACKDMGIAQDIKR